TVDVREGLRRTIDWFRSQSLVLEQVSVPMPSEPALLTGSAVQ
ncbi:MAG: hypothetical protein JWN96_3512, partial [Mycobacterium sp.]|nr:hypothetical protein [Mycobacterium sp.]